MKNILLYTCICLLVLNSTNSKAQGLPPGWDYNATPSTHIISIPLFCNPNINGYSLMPGDYIGVFYLDDQGEFACGGAEEWNGITNTGIIAFGDDSFTTEKDGFSSGETINYKVYSWSVLKEYDATVECNDSLPCPCDVFVPGCLSGLLALDAYGYYIVLVSDPDTICTGNGSQLTAIPSGGSGNYSYEWSSIPPGFSSNIPNPVVYPEENTSYIAIVSDEGEYLTDTLIINVVPPPQANAGDDFSICENQTAQLNGDVQNANSFQWNTSGDGTFSDPLILNPEYTPGTVDIQNGSVILTLSAQPNDPCTEIVYSDMNLTIVGLPTVQAGDDNTICENETYQLSGLADNYSSIIWSTSGDGIFDDPNSLNAVYTPGTMDISNGNVILTLTASPISPCSGNIFDNLEISFAYLPLVNAGDDTTICEGDEVFLNPDVSNFSGVLWTSAGDGTFNNPTLLNAVYTPGNNDIINGNVILTLSAYSLIPCMEIIEDQLEVTIILQPEAYAGDDATICEDSDHQLQGEANNYDLIQWATDGDGTFDDPNSLIAIYTPGPEDISSGQVNLTLIAEPLSPCTLQANDELTLAIISLPDVNAGDDATICEDSDHQLQGEANNYELIQWTTNGDGTFNNPNSLIATYTPGPEDILSGQVNLTLTAYPLSPCTESQEDSILLEFVLLPSADAGEDATVKTGETYQLNGNAANYLSVIWSTFGDGTFDDTLILNPVYTPGTEDINNAEVTLELTALPNLPCTNNVSDQMVLTIDTLINIPEDHLKNGIKIFPNPNNGIFIVSGLPSNEKFQFLIYNSFGKLIYSKKIITGIHESKTENFKVNVSYFENGLYFIKIRNEKYNFTNKVIISKM